MCMYASIDFNYLLMARGCTIKDLRHCANGLFHKKRHLVVFANVGLSIALSFKEIQINYFDTCAVIIVYCIIEFSTYRYNVKLLSNLMLCSTRTNQQKLSISNLFYFF